VSPDPGARGVAPASAQGACEEVHAGSRAPELKARGREPSGRPDSGMVLEAERGTASCAAACGPRGEKRAAERRWHRRRGAPGARGRNALWVDLLLDEGGECDELMMVRQGFSFNWC
jgi:hypothetical protein